MLGNRNSIQLHAVQNRQNSVTVIRHGSAICFFTEFIRDWEDIRKKLDIHKIDKEEYEGLEEHLRQRYVSKDQQ